MNTITLYKDLGIVDLGGYKARYGIYICPVCEGKFEARTNNVNTGNTKMCKPCSCNKSIRHGDTANGSDNKRLYSIWCDIKSRCLNKSIKSYSNYGARGISVCNAWMEYETFKEWAIASGYEKNLTIDRIDVDGDYCPENCKWSDHSHQASNKRKKEGATSKYIGVTFDKSRCNWVAQVCFRGKRKSLGRFSTELSAATARDNYIKQNNLPHKLNL